MKKPPDGGLAGQVAGESNLVICQEENKQVIQEEVDDTIKATCKWVQSNLKQTSSIDQSMMVPEMIKALAELISARGR